MCGRALLSSAKALSAGALADLLKVHHQDVSGTAKLRCTSDDAQSVVQVYTPAGTWSVVDLFDGDSEEPLVDGYAGGLPVAMQFGNNTAMLLCGGVDAVDGSRYTNTCTRLLLDASNSLDTSFLQDLNLTFAIVDACHGSDGQQLMMIAGGFGEN